MKRDPTLDRAPLAYHLLDRWMRVIAVLVPKHIRGRWLAEWDGELWYGIAGKRMQPRWRAAAGLAKGLLHDALQVRRLETSNHGRDGGRGDGSMRSLMTDVRYSLRMLRKAPGFATVVVITLALGIGATVTIFSVVNSLLLNPLPYPDADRLVIMWMGRTGANVDRDWFLGAQFSDIQDQTRSFEELTLTRGGSSTLTGRGRPMRLGSVRAPSSYLRMLGASATVGRVFDEGDDRGDASRVALLTYGLLQRSYGGDASVVGQTLTLDGNEVEIVGVLSPDVLLDSEVMPTMEGIGPVDVVLSYPLSGEALTDRLSEMFNIVGKLQHGVPRWWIHWSRSGANKRRRDAPSAAH